MELLKKRFIIKFQYSSVSFSGTVHGHVTKLRTLGSITSGKIALNSFSLVYQHPHFHGKGFLILFGKFVFTNMCNKFSDPSRKNVLCGVHSN